MTSNATSPLKVLKTSADLLLDQYDVGSGFTHKTAVDIATYRSLTPPPYTAALAGNEVTSQVFPDAALGALENVVIQPVEQYSKDLYQVKLVFEFYTPSFREFLYMQKLSEYMSASDANEYAEDSNNWGTSDSNEFSMNMKSFVQNWVSSYFIQNQEYLSSVENVEVMVKNMQPTTSDTSVTPPPSITLSSLEANQQEKNGLLSKFKAEVLVNYYNDTDYGDIDGLYQSALVPLANDIINFKPTCIDTPHTDVKYMDIYLGQLINFSINGLQYNCHQWTKSYIENAINYASSQVDSSKCNTVLSYEWLNLNPSGADMELNAKIWYCNTFKTSADALEFSSNCSDLWTEFSHHLTTSVSDYTIGQMEEYNFNNSQTGNTSGTSGLTSSMVESAVNSGSGSSDLLFDDFKLYQESDTSGKETYQDVTVSFIFSMASSDYSKSIWPTSLDMQGMEWQVKTTDISSTVNSSLSIGSIDVNNAAAAPNLVQGSMTELEFSNYDAVDNIKGNSKSAIDSSLLDLIVLSTEDVNTALVNAFKGGRFWNIEITQSSMTRGGITRYHFAVSFDYVIPANSWSEKGWPSAIAIKPTLPSGFSYKNSLEQTFTEMPVDLSIEQTGTPNYKNSSSDSAQDWGIYVVKPSGVGAHYTKSLVKTYSEQPASLCVISDPDNGKLSPLGIETKSGVNLRQVVDAQYLMFVLNASNEVISVFYKGYGYSTSASEYYQLFGNESWIDITGNRSGVYASFLTTTIGVGSYNPSSPAEFHTPATFQNGEVLVTLCDPKESITVFGFSKAQGYLSESGFVSGPPSSSDFSDFIQTNSTALSVTKSQYDSNRSKFIKYYKDGSKDKTTTYSSQDLLSTSTRLFSIGSNSMKTQYAFIYYDSSSDSEQYVLFYFSVDFSFGTGILTNSPLETPTGVPFEPSDPDSKTQYGPAIPVSYGNQKGTSGPTGPLDLINTHSIFSFEYNQLGQGSEVFNTAAFGIFNGEYGFLNLQTEQVSHPKSDESPYTATLYNYGDPEVGKSYTIPLDVQDLQVQISPGGEMNLFISTTQGMVYYLNAVPLESKTVQSPFAKVQGFANGFSGVLAPIAQCSCFSAPTTSSEFLELGYLTSSSSVYGISEGELWNGIWPKGGNKINEQKISTVCFSSQISGGHSMGFIGNKQPYYTGELVIKSAVSNSETGDYDLVAIPPGDSLVEVRASEAIHLLNVTDQNDVQAHYIDRSSSAILYPNANGKVLVAVKASSGNPATLYARVMSNASYYDEGGMLVPSGATSQSTWQVVSLGKASHLRASNPTAGSSSTSSIVIPSGTKAYPNGGSSYTTNSSLYKAGITNKSTYSSSSAADDVTSAVTSILKQASNAVEQEENSTQQAVITASNTNVNPHTHTLSLSTASANDAITADFSLGGFFDHLAHSIASKAMHFAHWVSNEIKSELKSLEAEFNTLDQLIIKGLDYAGNAFSTVISDVSAALDSLWSKLKSIAKDIANFVEKVIDFLLGFLNWEDIVQLAQSFSSLMKDTLSNGILSSGSIKSASSYLQDNLSGFIETLDYDLSGNVDQKSSTVVKDIEKGLGYVMWLPNKIMGPILNDLDKIVSDLESEISLNIDQTLQDQLDTIFEGIMMDESLKTLFEAKIYTSIANAVTNGGLSEPYSWINGFVSDIVGDILSFTNLAADNVISLISALCELCVEAVSTIMNFSVNSYLGVIGWILDLLDVELDLSFAISMAYAGPVHASYYLFTEKSLTETSFLTSYGYDYSKPFPDCITYNSNAISSDALGLATTSTSPTHPVTSTGTAAYATAAVAEKASVTADATAPAAPSQDEIDDQAYLTASVLLAQNLLQALFDLEAGALVSLSSYKNSQSSYLQFTAHALGGLLPLMTQFWGATPIYKKQTAAFVANGKTPSTTATELKIANVAVSTSLKITSGIIGLIGDSLSIKLSTEEEEYQSLTDEMDWVTTCETEYNENISHLIQYDHNSSDITDESLYFYQTVAEKAGYDQPYDFSSSISSTSKTDIDNFVKGLPYRYSVNVKSSLDMLGKLQYTDSCIGLLSEQMKYLADDVKAYGDLSDLSSAEQDLVDKLEKTRQKMSTQSQAQDIVKTLSGYYGIFSLCLSIDSLVKLAKTDTSQWKAAEVITFSESVFSTVLGTISAYSVLFPSEESSSTESEAENATSAASLIGTISSGTMMVLYFMAANNDSL